MNNQKLKQLIPANVTKVVLVLMLVISVFISGCSSGNGDISKTDEMLFYGSVGAISAFNAVANIPVSIVRSVGGIGDPVMEIHGIVNDYHGNPVEGVIVTGYYDHGNRQRLKVRTGPDGKFVFNNQATRVAICYFEKEGYESCRKGLRSIEYNYPEVKQGEKKEVFSNADKPISLNVRKLGQINYILYQNTYTRFKDNRYNQDYCFAKYGWFDRYGLKHSLEQKDHKCLNVSGEFNEKDGVYDFSFTYLGENGGVIVDGNTLNIAPEDGYKKTVYLRTDQTHNYSNLLVDHNKKEYRRMVYVKCSECNMYSRADLLVRVDENGRPRQCELNFYTNPENGRNLDFHARDSFKIQDDRRALSDRFHQYHRKALKKHRDKQKNKPVAERESFDFEEFKKEYVRRMKGSKL